MSKILGTYNGNITLRASAHVDSEDTSGLPHRGDEEAPSTEVKAPNINELERIINEAISAAGYVGTVQLTRTDR